MEDLKIVLYVAAAIIWVVYNNYKKISEASRKRNISKLPPEVIPENWPKTSQDFGQQKTNRKVFATDKQSVKPKPGTLIKEALKARSPLQRTPLASGSMLKKNQSIVNEGGSTKPSKVVHFEDQSSVQLEANYLVEEIRNMDLKKAIILSEVLKRPYN